MSEQERVREVSTKGIDVVYLEPEIVNQRLRTLAALQLRSGERAADIGCGNGLLTQPMALAVGDRGHIAAVDNNPEMLDMARATCAGLDQIEWRTGTAEDLPVAGESMDALACTQVLLYVPDVARALAEFHRVLKPRGRLAVLETDWRGTVFNSSRDDITRRVLAAWDAAVANPNLPTRLGPMLREQGFTAIKVEAIPVLNTNYSNSNFSGGALASYAELARDNGAITGDEAAAWIADFQSLGDTGAYFFCVNRFLFSAVKV